MVLIAAWEPHDMQLCFSWNGSQNAFQIPNIFMVKIPIMVTIMIMTISIMVMSMIIFIWLTWWACFWRCSLWQCNEPSSPSQFQCCQKSELEIEIRIRNQNYNYNSESKSQSQLEIEIKIRISPDLPFRLLLCLRPGYLPFWCLDCC